MLMIRKKNILVLGEGPTQGLDDTKITAEDKYSIDITTSRKNICLSLHYNRSKSFLYANGIKVYQFKAKDLEIKPYLLRLGNISKDSTVDNMKKAGLNGYVYDFSVDYNTIDVTNISNIHMYLTNKHGMI